MEELRRRRAEQGPRAQRGDATPEADVGVRTLRWNEARESNTSTSAHRVKELPVVLGLLHLVDKEFRGFEVVHRVQELAQYPHLLQNIWLEQELFLSRARAVHVDRRISALLRHPPVEVDFHVARALE